MDAMNIGYIVMRGTVCPNVVNRPYIITANSRMNPSPIRRCHGRASHA